MLGPGGQRLGHPGTCRAVERAIAYSFGLLVPYLPDVQRLTLDLADPRRLGPVVSTSRRSLVGRHHTTKRYRVLSTSKRWGTETRRYSNGTVRTIDTRSGDPVAENSERADDRLPRDGIPGDFRRVER